MTPGQLSPEDARPVTLTEGERHVLHAWREIGRGTHNDHARHYNDPLVGWCWKRQSPSGLRSRTAALVDLGLVCATEDTDWPHPGITTGRKATVWAITDAGRRAL